MARVSVFLITAALIVGMIGCIPCGDCGVPFRVHLLPETGLSGRLQLLCKIARRECI